jgi:response regulator RpfG family c-di-GMP phosphodiesterase/signal transduction histidine kinase
LTRKRKNPAGIGAIVLNNTIEQARNVVLLVDDDPAVVEILETSLSRANYRVLSAESGVQALARAKKDSPDLILLDVTLPDLDSLEVCRQLKENILTSWIPVIMLGNQVDSRDVIAGISAGAEDYVVKPFGPSDIIGLIQTHLRRKGRGEEANPVTGLPGDLFLSREVDSLISEGRLIAVMYIELNSIDVFRRSYGAAYGDCAVQFLSEILSDAVQLFGGADDQVGHTGNGSFVIVTTPERAETLCRRVIADFDNRIDALYAPEDLTGDYVVQEDLTGQVNISSFLTVSIAVVTNDWRKVDNYLEFGQIGAEISNYVKELPGSNYCFDQQCRGVTDTKVDPEKDGQFSHLHNLRAMHRAMSWVNFLSKEMTIEIASIRSHLDSIMRSRLENLNNEQLRNLEYLDRSTVQLSAVVEELTSSALNERGEKEEYLDNFDLAEILDAIVNMTGKLAIGRKVKVDTLVDEHISPLMADKKSVVRSLHYVLRAQIESSKAGDCIRIRVHEEAGDYVAVEIGNPGCYIPASQQAALFERQRYDAVGESMSHDLHLALSLVRGMGGDISVESKRNLGTKFTVLIPRWWRSRIDRINRIQSWAETSAKAVQEQFDGIRRFHMPMGEDVQLTAKEGMASLESKVRELEAACNLSLLTADELGNSLERQNSRVLEQEFDTLLILEAIQIMAAQVAHSIQTGYEIDVEGAKRVSRYALAIAAELKLPADERWTIYRAALLKDMRATLNVGRAIASRTQPNSERMFSLQKLLGEIEELLSHARSLQPALAIASHKHERYDGTGCPSRLKGSGIPMGARILAVAEAFNTMVSGLSPLGIVSPEDALRELATDSGHRFDPQVVAAFLVAWRAGKVKPNRVD